MNRRILFLDCLTLWMAGLAAFPTQAATVTLPASGDTGLFAAAPDNNLGGMTYVAIGTTSIGDPARGLFQFDIARDLPPGVVIESAALNLTTVDILRFSTHLYGVHRVLRDWGEGLKFGGGSGMGSLGALAGPGESTWRYRHSTSASWGQPGGQAGVDYVESPSATLEITGLGTVTWSGPTLTSDVIAWQQSPATNFGWMVILENELSFFGSARRFQTREAEQATPSLTIVYTAPLLFDTVRLDAQGIVLGWQRQPNTAYVLEHRPAVDQGQWFTLTNVAAEPGGGAVEATDSVSAGQRYYRIRVGP